MNRTPGAFKSLHLTRPRSFADSLHALQKIRTSSSISRGKKLIRKEKKKKPQVKLKGTRGAKLLALDSKGLRLNIVKQFTYLIDMS